MRPYNSIPGQERGDTRSRSRLRDTIQNEVGADRARFDIGPDHKVIDMRSFFGALVTVLRAAHEQGSKDRSEPEGPER